MFLFNKELLLKSTKIVLCLYATSPAGEHYKEGSEEGSKKESSKAEGLFRLRNR
jgi:hypothetical protein